MIIRLETLDDARLDVFARLTDVQLRSRLEPERAILIAESDKVAARALEAGLQPVSLLVGEKWLQPLSGLLDQVEAAAPGTPVFVLPPEELQRLTGFELTRGLLAAFRRPAHNIRTPQHNKTEHDILYHNNTKYSTISQNSTQHNTTQHYQC